jgi:hypothetical protein
VRCGRGRRARESSTATATYDPDVAQIRLGADGGERLAGAERRAIAAARKCAAAAEARQRSRFRRFIRRRSRCTRRCCVAAKNVIGIWETWLENGSSNFFINHPTRRTAPRSSESASAALVCQLGYREGEIMATVVKWSGVAVAVQSALGTARDIASDHESESRVVSTDFGSPTVARLFERRLRRARRARHEPARRPRGARGERDDEHLRARRRRHDELRHVLQRHGAKITYGTTLSTLTGLSASGGDYDFIDTTTIHDTVKTQVPGPAAPGTYSFESIWDPADTRDSSRSRRRPTRRRCARSASPGRTATSSCSTDTSAAR